MAKRRQLRAFDSAQLRSKNNNYTMAADHAYRVLQLVVVACVLVFAYGQGPDCTMVSNATVVGISQRCAETLMCTHVAFDVVQFNIDDATNTLTVLHANLVPVVPKKDDKPPYGISILSLAIANTAVYFFFPLPKVKRLRSFNHLFRYTAPSLCWQRTPFPATPLLPLPCL